MRATNRQWRQKIYTVTFEQFCAGCKGRIPAGNGFWKDRTKQPWHPACKRIGVTTTRVETPRYLFDDPVGEKCDGCGMEITEDDIVVHKSAKPWHKECSLVR